MQMEKTEDKLLKPSEMAVIMGYSKQGFYNLSDDVKPPAIKRSGKAWRYRYSTYQRWLDQQEAQSGIRSVATR
jgi:predicted DNA-binding transcriptional regulator AlpA